jgi:hypothetical protein
MKSYYYFWKCAINRPKTNGMFNLGKLRKPNTTWVITNLIFKPVKFLWVYYETLKHKNYLCSVKNYETQIGFGKPMLGFAKLNMPKLSSILSKKNYKIFVLLKHEKTGHLILQKASYIHSVFIVFYAQH